MKNKNESNKLLKFSKKIRIIGNINETRDLKNKKIPSLLRRREPATFKMPGRSDSTSFSDVRGIFTNSFLKKSMSLASMPSVRRNPSIKEIKLMGIPTTADKPVQCELTEKPKTSRVSSAGNSMFSKKYVNRSTESIFLSSSMPERPQTKVSKQRNFQPLEGVPRKGFKSYCITPYLYQRMNYRRKRLLSSKPLGIRNTELNFYNKRYTNVNKFCYNDFADRDFGKDFLVAELLFKKNNINN